MGRYVFFFVVTMSVLGGAYYIIHDKGVMQERLREQERSVAALRQQLQMSQKAQKQSMQDLQAFQKEREQELRSYEETKERLQSRLVALQRTSASYTKQIERLRQERNKLAMQSSHSKEQLQQELKEKDEAIATLQRRQKSIECLQLDAPGGVVDELFGVRAETNGTAAPAASSDT